MFMPSLVRPIGRRRVTPLQSVAIAEDDTTQHTAVINPRPAMALEEIRPQACDLLIC